MKPVKGLTGNLTRLEGGRPKDSQFQSLDRAREGVYPVRGVCLG